MMVNIHITRTEVKNIQKKYVYKYCGTELNTGIDKILASVEYLYELPNTPNGKADNIIEIIHNTMHIFHPNKIDDCTLYDNGQ